MQMKDGKLDVMRAEELFKKVYADDPEYLKRGLESLEDCSNTGKWDDLYRTLQQSKYNNTGNTISLLLCKAGLDYKEELYRFRLGILQGPIPMEYVLTIMLRI